MDETLAGLVAGDPAAYARLWDRLGGRLFATARLLTGSVPEAEDSVHDLFVALARSRQGLAGVIDLDAYLFAALRHTVARRRKQAAARRATLEHLRRRVEETSGPHGPFGLPAEYPDERLAAAVARLPEEQREVVMLRTEAGLSFAEIAATLGVSCNTAASRWRYALEKLRSTFTPSEVLP